MTELIEIDGKKVYVDDDEIYKSYTVFTVEFEYDLRILVAYTYGMKTVWQELHSIIQALRSKTSQRFSQEAKRAFTLSKYLTVALAPIEFRPEDDVRPASLCAAKFRAIEALKTYFPYGYNHLHKDNVRRIEWPFRLNTISSIHRNPENTNGLSLRDLEEMHAQDFKVEKVKGKSTGRPGTPVYQYKYCPDYSGKGNNWKMIKEWPSLKAIIDANPTWKMSNISVCCSQPERTSHGFKWSHNPDTIF